MLTWVGLLLVPIVWWFLFRTRAGLRLRAIGEQPLAASTVGLKVIATRYAAVIASGILAALGGVYLADGFDGSFNFEMTDGRGFIALAAVIFGKWNPVRRARGGAPVRPLERARVPTSRPSRRRSARSSRRSLPAHADRRGRPDRALPASRRLRHPLREGVDPCGRATVHHEPLRHWRTALSDEVELYQRTYSTLLRSSGETRLRVLEPSHRAMGSSLHSLADSEELDLGAFLYCVSRLPAAIAGARPGRDGPVRRGADRRRPRHQALAGGGGPRAPAALVRRRLDGTLAVLLASASDVDDLVPTLVAYQIEWNKIRVRLRGAATELGEDPDAETCARLCGGSVEDWQRLRESWGMAFAHRLGWSAMCT